MPSARDRILANVRAALGETAEADPARVRQAAAELIGDPTPIQPKFDEPELERFVAKLTSPQLTGTVDRVATMAEAPRAVRQYLKEKGLGGPVSMVERAELTGLDWGDLAYHHTIAPDEDVAVGLAEAGIAETGSLVFHSGPGTPTLANFFPLHHVVVIEATRVVRHMEDYWRDFRQSGQAHPRNINLITGTSGTADIEAKNIRGAHGPRFLHVVIVGEA